MHAWRAFLRAHADLVGQMDATLRAEVGVPLQWYDVLTHIDEARVRAARDAFAASLPEGTLVRLEG